MNPAYDPQVLAARLHLRPHLIRLLDGVDMPEPLRGRVADALLAAGEVHRDVRVEVVDDRGDGLSGPARVDYAVLAIRHPWLGTGRPAQDSVEVTR